MKVADSRTVVTGGSGFIGSHLVDKLLAAGHDVVVIDDFSSGSPAKLAHHDGDSHLRIVEADVRDERKMFELLEGAAFVFHLATRNVRMSLQHPTVVHEVNTTGTLNVLKAAAAGGARRFLYCSSSEVNGTATIVPMPEQYPFAPETIYGASKLAGEYYTQVFHRAGWLDAVIARPHNNYGPREHYQHDKGEVIPRFILRALAGLAPQVYGDGAQTRDFTYVTETADYLVRLMECDAAVGDTFNVCRGEEVSVLEIASLVAELTGLDARPEHLPGRPSDVLRLCGDAAHLRETLGSSPGVSIRDGLAKTVEWFRENVPVTDEVLAAMAPENWQTLPAEPWLGQLDKREGDDD